MWIIFHCRHEQRFKREGVNIPYSTISDWIKNGCVLLDALGESLKKMVISSNYLHADETPLKVLDKNKKGTTHRGFYWVYHNSLDNLVWFDYREGRGREGPNEILKDFKGYLQTDGYNVYDIFKENKDITVLHCMAHARRKFFEAKDNIPTVAEYALEQIGLLYAIERNAKEQKLTADGIFELRQTEAVPILESLGKWMKETYITSLPKSTIGKALGYSIERWSELMIYTSDGKLNIDNNPVENSINKSVSHNFGNSFISLMNYINDDYFMGHLLKQARKTKCNKLTVDILKNIAEPKELLTDQIKSSIEHWNKWFPTLVESSGSTLDYVSSATMTIEFDLQQTRPYASNSDYLESPFACEIIIIDDRNKEYKDKHKHEGWWFPETK